MTLKKYQKKRTFETTPEPDGKKRKSSQSFRFCVQEHHARRLHYDFRLEYKGILLSWAIPKGPSLMPHEKRLAIHVEDHPLDYQYFEGTIPKGNYGAGKVEIWDKGTYTTVEGQTFEEVEKNIRYGMSIGHLAIILNGKKLKGEYILQKLKKDLKNDSAWLLIKKTDSLKSLTRLSSKEDKQTSAIFPTFIPPMLCTLIDKPFSDKEWLFEKKWDGYRTLAFIDNGKVYLKSRNNIVFTQFPTIEKQLKQMQGQYILDGEIITVDSKGKPNFQLLQQYQKKPQGNLIYFVFDLLYQEGTDLRKFHLIERKQRLENLINRFNFFNVKYCPHLLEKGENFFNTVINENLEGMIGKRIKSLYLSSRSKEWVKVKTSLRQEVVIGGFTEPTRTRKNFGALLIGVYNEKKEFTFVGHVGGGFDQSTLKDLHNEMSPLIQKTSPFKVLPKSNQKATWLLPILVCEVKFVEWTGDNIMRQPIFLGMRRDKNAEQVKKESAAAKPTKKITASTKKITLTHLEKVYWPAEGYTKGDLIEYYTQIAPFILPYLKNRPMILHRYPNGVEGADFYQKDINIELPKGIKTTPVLHEEKTDNYLLINNLDSLLYAVNLGSIELHPLLARIKNLQCPDFCVIDLDPHDIPFDQVVEVALFIHQTLEKIKVKNFCKTSGGKGLHILIPLNGKYTFEQSKQFAEILGHFVNVHFPKQTSMQRSPEKRPGKIYIDCLQNHYGQAIAAPYTVRARPGATISTPLEWDEVNTHLSPAQFNLKSIWNRLKNKKDILLPLLKSSVNLKLALKRMEKLL